MSFGVLENVHYLSGYKQFPRASYFGQRFIGLIPRLFKILAALPDNLTDSKLKGQLKSLEEALGRRVTIIVCGSRDISDKDLGISQVVQSSADKTAAGEDGLSIVILATEFEKIDLNAEKTLESIAVQFSRSSAKDKLLSFKLLIVHCRVPEHYLSTLTDDQLDQFRTNVMQKLDLLLGSSFSLKNILVEQNETNIQLPISDVLENLVIDSFSAIKDDLQRFIRRDQTTGIHYAELMKDEELASAIKSFVEDRMFILNIHNETKDEKLSTDLVISKLTTKVKCGIIPLLGKRFTIPDRICSDLLQESKFEENLRKALKTDTVRRLREIYENILAQAEEHTFSSSDEFVDILKEDWKEVFGTTERIFGSMTRVISVMKKMIFEIDGYLKQSKKYKYLSLPDVSHQLTDDLRKDLLSIEGVYGVGHVYGQLEIHVNVKENELYAVNKLVDELLHKYNFQESYSVKRIEANI